MDDCLQKELNETTKIVNESIYVFLKRIDLYCNYERINGSMTLSRENILAF